MASEEEKFYVLFDKSQISMVLSLTQQNIVEDFGDQIASKNTFEFDDGNIMHGRLCPTIHNRTVQSALALKNIFSANGDQCTL